MENEEEIRLAYFRKRQQLEEQEEDIQHFGYKGEDLAQQTFSAIHYRVRQQEEGDYAEIIGVACREIEQLEVAYQEELQEKKRFLRQREEEYELEYRMAMRQLEANKRER